ncbi:mitochondrial 54S ribosomal protein mL61 [Magnusiomyces paraingens]|uniref:Ribosomal protein/NADH dehydrogenase domain-containing protein n=1 Tax=Magnusiomyces paraingens TaxID=2606893 RepID=A0A5E8BU57_9ASCO|nr:uncharacterized protein SAPINGB_P004372 [Saprochaete ingens]VVT55006.1 unnamed protein product [Saprochaete ingens]
MFKALPKSRVPRQIALLNRISSGPAAVNLPTKVSSIALSFKFQNSNGHMGARRFWQLYLPQVQFNNPQVPISINRFWANNREEHANIPATLTITFADGSSKAIPVQHKHSDEILKEFIEAAGATPIPIEQQVIIKKSDESDKYTAAR